MLGKNETEKGLLSKQSIKPLEGMGGMSMNKLNKTEMGEYEMM
jgi:hypothetical protein